MAAGMKNKAWEPRHGAGNLCPDINTALMAQPKATHGTCAEHLRRGWEERRCLARMLRGQHRSKQKVQAWTVPLFHAEYSATVSPTPHKGLTGLKKKKT